LNVLFGSNNQEKAMHFSHIHNHGGSKASNIAIVAGFHLALGALFVHSLNARHIALPKLPEPLVVMFTPETPPPPTPPEPPRPMPKTAPPQIVAPPVEVQVQQPAPPDVVTAAVSADPAPQPPSAPPQPQAAAAAPASPHAGVLRSAVLADANACARPDYPSGAARRGESGTVALALLVGTDGRVAGSRIQSSSGSRELDKAAISALSMCKFKPATAGGVAEQAWAQIAYVWTLEQ
jgi:protein TonB